jgi:hypothetical protein
MASASSPPQQRRITSPREKAKMVYLPPDFDVPALIAQTPNFKAIPTVDATQLVDEKSWCDLEAFIEQHVITNGVPLVIVNWHKRADWPWYLFSPDWLAQNHGHDRS